VLVVGGMLSIAMQAAIFHMMGLLLVAIPEDTGWSRSTTSLALSALVLGSGFWAPAIGGLLQRWGPRPTMVVGGLTTAAGLVALGLARSPEELAVAIVLLISPGSNAMGSLSTYTVVLEWFRVRRGIALSIADSGASVGLMLGAPLVQQHIALFGWRSACFAIAVVSVCLALLHLVIQRPPAVRQTASTSPDERAEPASGFFAQLQNPLVWWVGIGLAASRFAFQLIDMHQVAYLTDQGFSVSVIAAVFALTGFAGLAGRPGFGWFSDRIGTPRVYTILTGCVLLAIACLVVAGQTGLLPVLWVYALSFGAVLGVGTLLFARQVSEVVGSRGFGSALGFGYALGSVGGAAGGAAAGFVYDATGTYLTSFAAAAVMALVSLGCMWVLGRGIRSAAAAA
jgi:predicted MFS family arabinose efflux permease